MYFIHGGRATGKTTVLIQWSAMTGIPIMTTAYHRIGLYKERAKQMGLKIPEPILWKNRQEGMGIDKRQVLIDDGEHFLDYVLMQTAGVRCAGMTICEPIFELPKWEADQFSFAKIITAKRMSSDVHTYGDWDKDEKEE